MASPSPSDLKPLPLEHAYQSSDTISCHCGVDKLETNKTERDRERISPVSIQYQHTHAHQHYQHTAAHALSQVHVHVHTPAPQAPKTMANCTCHLQNVNDAENGGQDPERKIEADDRIEISPLPPALPPRPPPRPRYDGSLSGRYRQRDSEYFKHIV